MLQNVCTPEFRSKQTKSGFGWLKLLVVDAYGRFLPDGSPCDWGELSNCDSYVRMHIDGEEVYNTDVIDNESKVVFYNMYTSKRLDKSLPVRLNLRDEDHSQDDSLVRVDGCLYEINGIQRFQFKEHKHYFTTIAYWRNEYLYENTYKDANEIHISTIPMNEIGLIISY